MRRSCCAFHWNKNSKNLETGTFRESFQKKTDILELPTSKPLDWKFWKFALAVLAVNMHILLFPVHPHPMFITRKRDFQRSLRTKRFHGVGERRKSEERDFRREKWCESQKVLSIFRAGKTPKTSFLGQFFAAKPHGDSCCAGYFRRSNIWWGSTALFDR